MATGTAGPLTSYPQPCLRPQHFPLLRPGCHSELGRVPSGDHSAPAAPGHCGGAPTTPQHSQLCSQLGPATWAPVSTRLGPLGCRTRSLCGRWSFQRLPPPAARVGWLITVMWAGCSPGGFPGSLESLWSLRCHHGSMDTRWLVSASQGHALRLVSRHRVVLGLWGPLSGTQALRVHLVLSRPFGGLPEW